MNGNSFDPRRRQRRFGDRELTRRILDRTSGSACGRAEALLGGRWDHDLETGDEALLQEHLVRCAACRRLAAVLADLQPRLAALAERQPGPEFTASVLAATSGSQPVAAAAAPTTGPVRAPLRAIERWALSLQDALRRAWQRPRFALEAAWTAAALASLLVLSPLAPEQAPRQLGQVVQAGAHAVPELIEAAGRRAATTLAAGQELVAPPLAWFLDRAEGIGRSLVTRDERSNRNDET